MTVDRFALWAMLTLSFSTGVLDAATYLGLHGVFTANMTGNLIFVGLGATGQATVPVLRALLALAGFVLGAALAGRALRRSVSSGVHDRRASSSVLVVGVMLGASAVALAVSAHGTALLDTLTVVMAVAMGVQAMAARRVGIGDVTTVVVTSTLAGLAGDNPAMGGSADGRLTGRRALAVATMGSGAVAGAFLMLVSVEVAVGVSALLTTGAAGVLMVRGRILQPR